MYKPVNATLHSADVNYHGWSSVPVNFDFESVLGFLPGALGGDQKAHLTLSVKTTQPATKGGEVNQPMEQLDKKGNDSSYGLLTITRDAPYLFKGRKLTNLLTVKFVARTGLDGHLNGQTANMVADTTNSDALGRVDIVQFTSDFLNFDPLGDENLDLAFTSVTPCFTEAVTATKPSRGPCAVSKTNYNFVHSFTAAGAGTFASNPEPNSVFAPEPKNLLVGLAGLGLLGLSSLGTKRVRREQRDSPPNA